jgi:hypothetical protein
MQAGLAKRRLSFREVFEGVPRLLLYVCIAMDFRINAYRNDREVAAAWQQLMNEAPSRPLIPESVVFLTETISASKRLVRVLLVPANSDGNMVT